MAQDSGVTANTELSATKQTLISSIVQRELVAAAQIAKTVQDVSMFAVKGMKSINFPKTGSLTVSNRATGEKGSKQTLSFSNDQLDLNQNAFISWLIDSTDELQSTVEVQAEFIKRAAGAHARNLDSKILDMLFAAASDVSQTGTITADKIINMRQYLLSKNAILSDLTLVVDTVQEAAMLKIDNFVRADAYGSSNIPDGAIGKVYGIPVMVQNGLPSGCNAMMYEKSAGCFGFQKGATYDEQKAIEYGTNSKLCVVDQLFGVKALQTAQGGASANKSPLITALIPGT